jgi:vesicle-fusing ATPase
VLLVGSASVLSLNARAFTFPSVSSLGAAPYTRNVLLFSASPTKPLEEGPILDTIPADFQPLFASIANVTRPRGAVTDQTAHDSFRYEWGTWVDENAMETLLNQVNQVRIANARVWDILHEDGNTNSRLRVASGQDWDVVLHVLPPDTSWKGQWPTGSWAIIKTLIGTAEIATLGGPDRNGIYNIKTKKSLRGGGDGTMAGGASTAGADCIKYVGGPLRQYTGKATKTIVMEVVIRPPIGTASEEMEELSLDIDQILSIVIPEPEPEPEKEETPAKPSSLGSAMGMDFTKVGGLDQQLNDIARRVLASRANPQAAKRLGVSHVRGILLSGPPGCGKTLLARELAQLLGAREPQIVNGPEILDRFIGEAERKVRDLFAPAEQEYREAGDDSALHIIVLDEMDAIARKRGSMTSDTTGVRDSVVNQLLAKMDDVKEASNV